MATWEERLGKRVRLMRRVRDLTQEELAADVGVHQSDVSRWENAEGPMGFKDAIRVARNFQCPVAVLDPDVHLPVEHLMPAGGPVNATGAD